MAAQGWLVDRFDGFFLRYKSVEPCRKQFYIDILPQITPYDYPENDDAQYYRRICEESGWEFITANRQIHVFCADEDNPAPVPIHTDNKIQARIYLNASRKQELVYFLIMVILFGFQVFHQLYLHGIEIFLRDSSVFIMLAYFFIMVPFVWTLISVFLWYKQTGKCAKLDLPMPSGNYKMSLLRRKIFIIGSAAALTCVFIAVGTTFFEGLSPVFLLFPIPLLLAAAIITLARRQIDTKPRTRKANRIMFNAASFLMMLVTLFGMGFVMVYMFRNTDSLITFNRNLGDRPIITLKDIGIESEPDPERIYVMVNGSIAVPVNYSYWESSQNSGIQLEVYRSVNKLLTRGLYNRFVSQLGRRQVPLFSEYRTIKNLSPDEAIFWGADEGVAVIGNLNGQTEKLILLNGKNILQISFSDGSTDDGINLDIAANAVRGFWELIGR